MESLSHSTDGPVNENVAPIHYAGFWIRVVAYLIDAVILNSVAWVLEMAVMGAIYWVSIFMNSQNQAAFADYLSPFAKQLVFLGISSILELVYYVVGHHRYGTTLGKRIFNIYVVDLDSGQFLSLWKSFVRAIGSSLSAVIFGAGYLMVAFHPKKRALHDLMAGSISIIREPGIKITH